MPWRIGCGGWWGFDGGLPRYAHRFDFVEVNTSYYRLPSLSVACGWRRSVPEDFEFSVVLPWERPIEVGPLLSLLESLRARYGVVHATLPWREEALTLLHDHGYVPVLSVRGAGGPLPSLPPWVVVSSGDQEVFSPGGDAYLRVFGVPQGIPDHLSAGMVRRAVQRARDASVSGKERIRVVTHSVQMYEDAERIRRLLGDGNDG